MNIAICNVPGYINVPIIKSSFDMCRDMEREDGLYCLEARSGVSNMQRVIIVLSLIMFPWCYNSFSSIRKKVISA